MSLFCTISEILSIISKTKRGHVTVTTASPRPFRGQFVVRRLGLAMITCASYMYYSTDARRQHRPIPREHKRPVGIYRSITVFVLSVGRSVGKGRVLCKSMGDRASIWSASGGPKERSFRRVSRSSHGKGQILGQYNV